MDLTAVNVSSYEFQFKTTIRTLGLSVESSVEGWAG
jgi:hypothetical protein